MFVHWRSCLIPKFVDFIVEGFLLEEIIYPLMLSCVDKNVCSNLHVSLKYDWQMSISDIIFVTFLIIKRSFVYG